MRTPAIPPRRIVWRFLSLNTFSLMGMLVLATLLWSATYQRDLDHAVRSERLAVQSRTWMSTDRTLGMLLAVEAYRAANTRAARQALFAAALTDADSVKFLNGHPGPILALAFSPDGGLLASAGQDGAILLWQISGLAPPVTIGDPLIGHTGRVTSLAFSPDGNLLASGSQDGTVLIWDGSLPRALGPLNRLVGQGAEINSVAFNPDGRLLAAGNQDGTVRLWDVGDVYAPAALGAPLTAHTQPVTGLAFLPQGSILASSSAGGSLQLWDISEPASAIPFGSTLEIESTTPAGVTFSPDGTLMAVGSTDGRFRLWLTSDLRSPVLLPLPPTSYSAILALAFSPKDKMLATGSEDHGLRLWDLTDPRLLQRFEPPLMVHSGPVTAVAFSPDGKWLAAGSTDQRISLWDVDPSAWQAYACRAAGRNLTAAEWKQFLGRRTYRPTCNPDQN